MSASGAHAIAKFRLGHIVATPKALESITQDDILTAIGRHQSGDWGDLDAEDRKANDVALIGHQHHNHIVPGVQVGGDVHGIIFGGNRFKTRRAALHVLAVYPEQVTGVGKDFQPDWLLRVRQLEMFPESDAGSFFLVRIWLPRPDQRGRKRRSVRIRDLSVQCAIWNQNFNKHRENDPTKGDFCFSDPPVG